jgi:hypothetical protein
MENMEDKLETIGTKITKSIGGFRVSTSSNERNSFHS